MPTLKNIGSSKYIRRKTGAIVEPGETFVPGDHELRKITMSFEIGTRLEVVPDEAPSDETAPTEHPIGDPPVEQVPASTADAPVVEDKPVVPVVPPVTTMKSAKGQAKRA